MANGVSFFFIEGQRYYIKPALHILEIILRQKSLSDLSNLLLFGRIHRFLRKTIICASPCFHFHECQSFLVIGNNINFTPEQTVASGDDLVFIIY